MTGRQLAVHTLAPGTPGAPLVVLAHGLESAWTSWLPMAVELDPRWRVVALELPWRPGNDYRWRRRAAGEWLGDALDLLGATPDVLVAHSFGANATLELLCAMDPRPGPAVVLVCPLYRLARQPVSWRMFDRARAMFVAHVRGGLGARMGVRAGSLEPAVLDAMIDVAIDRVGPLGFLATFHQYAMSADLALGIAEVPALLIAGGADPTLAPEAARELAAGLPGAQLRFTDHFDHFCQVRHAREVAAQVVEFAAAARATVRTPGGPR